MNRRPIYGLTNRLPLPRPAAVTSPLAGIPTGAPVGSFLTGVLPPRSTMVLPLILHNEGTAPPQAVSEWTTYLTTLRTAHPWLVLTFLYQAMNYPGSIGPGATAVLRAGDELGAHLHPHNQLQTLVAIDPVKTIPTAAGATTPISGSGYYALLSGFTQPELEAMLQKTIDQITEAGFPAPVTFGAGYWLSTPTVRAALLAKGFTHDTSPVPVSNIGAALAAFPYLTGLLAARWPALDATTQPYNEGGVVQVVSNSAITGYHSAAQIFAWFQQAETAARARPSRRGVFPIVAHYESDAGLDPVRAKEALDLIVAYCTANNIALQSSRVRDLAAA